MSRGQTPSQTVGPFFAYGLVPEQYGYAFVSLVGSVVANEATQGAHIRLVGRVLDGEGAPIPDALVELWQADGAGRYAHPADAGGNAAFLGFGRCGTGTDAQHRFLFHTVKPGVTREGGAPHVNLAISMRGLLGHVFTRIYFADESAANDADPVLRSVPADRRGTLIAARDEGPMGVTYRLDIHMQGPNETVFFDA